MSAANGSLSADDPLYAPGLKLRPRSNGPPKRIWLATEKDRCCGFYKCHVSFASDLSDEQVASECREMWGHLLAWREGMSPNPLMFGRAFKKAVPLPDLSAHQGPGTIYFVQALGGERLIKIGYTTDIRERMGGLVTGSPYPLKLLASYPGPRQMESWLHCRFRSARQWGEWFLPTSELLTWTVHFHEELEHFRTTQSRTNVPFLGRRGEKRGTCFARKD